MNRTRFSWLLFWSALPLLGTAPTRPPRVMLWSWFAPDDFRFLTGSDVGVAYRALSLTFTGAKTVTPAPRYVPVWISPATYQMAVIRFDYTPFDRNKKPAFSTEQRHLAVEMIGEIAGLSHAPAVQIDFDAPESAHAFYRQLLLDLRERLGPTIFLSMTSLVTWCGARDSWLSNLPVDEVVPMAFDMGGTSGAVGTMLERGGRFASPSCQASIGVQAEQRTVIPPGTQRTYFFLPYREWSVDFLHRALLHAGNRAKP